MARRNGRTTHRCTRRINKVIAMTPTDAYVVLVQATGEVATTRAGHEQIQRALLALRPLVEAAVEPPVEEEATEAPKCSARRGRQVAEAG